MEEQQAAGGFDGRYDDLYEEEDRRRFGPAPARRLRRRRGSVEDQYPRYPMEGVAEGYEDDAVGGYDF